jgi:hypothetical protein
MANLNMQGRAVDNLVDAFIDKIKGDECLYKGYKRPDCLTKYGFPVSLVVKPKGWCEVCWLRFQISEKDVLFSHLQQEYNNLRRNIDKMNQDYKEMLKMIAVISKNNTKEKEGLVLGQQEFKFEF